MTYNVMVSKVEIKDAGKTKRLVLHYTSDKTKGQTWSVGALAPQLDTVSRDYLKALADRLKNGGTEAAGIEITKEGNYYNLTKIGAADAAPKTNTATKPAYKPFDDVGIKVGAARNQAIAFLSATKGAKFTLDDVDTLAYEIVTRQTAQEKAVREGSLLTLQNTEVETNIARANADAQSANVDLDSVDFGF